MSHLLSATWTVVALLITPLLGSLVSAAPTCVIHWQGVTHSIYQRDVVMPPDDRHGFMIEDVTSDGRILQVNETLTAHSIPIALTHDGTLTACWTENEDGVYSAWCSTWRQDFPGPDGRDGAWWPYMAQFDSVVDDYLPVAGVPINLLVMHDPTLPNYHCDDGRYWQLWGNARPLGDPNCGSDFPLFEKRAFLPTTVGQGE